jgi:hypothetical protein
MVLGMSLPTFTAVHVAISIIGILSGIVVVLGMIRNVPANAVTALFLTTTVLTSLTGFLFPFHGVTPGIVLGILSLVVLFFAILARYSFHLAGPWRWIYVVTSVIALFFNCLVLIVQTFEKTPALKGIAPTGAQVVNLLLFLVLGFFAVKKFHPAPTPAAP